MARARFVYDNKTLTSTITASASADFYPASFLKSRARWKQWRSTTTTGDQNVVFDFGSAQTIKAVAVVNWKKHGTTGTIRADYWTGAAYAPFDGGTGLFTLPSSNRTRLSILYFAAGRSTSRIRIYFTNTAAASDYVELGVCVAGDYFEPTVNLTEGMTFSYEDPSDFVESNDGQEVAAERTKYLGLSTDWLAISDADKNGFMTMYDAVGSTKPLIYAVDPTDLDQTVYGRFVQTLPATGAEFRRWNVSVPFKEVR